MVTTRPNGIAAIDLRTLKDHPAIGQLQAAIKNISEHCAMNFAADVESLGEYLNDFLSDARGIADKLDEEDLLGLPYNLRVFARHRDAVT